MTDPYRLALAECDTALRTKGPHAFRSWLDQKCLETNATIINERRELGMQLRGIATFDGWRPVEEEIKSVQVALQKPSGGGNYTAELWNKVPYRIKGKALHFSIELTQDQEDPRSEPVDEHGGGAAVIVHLVSGNNNSVAGVIKWL